MTSLSRQVIKKFFQEVTLCCLVDRSTYQNNFLPTSHPEDVGTTFHRKMKTVYQTIWRPLFFDLFNDAFIVPTKWRRMAGCAMCLI
jgi:hypothetical protein